MQGDYEKYLEMEKAALTTEKKRLGFIRDPEVQHAEGRDEQVEQSEKENIDTWSVTSCELTHSPKQEEQKLPLIERLDLSDNQGNLEKDKQAFIDSLINSENPLSFRTDEAFNSVPMLRYGEYSPNNPQFRVAAAPYLGLGEYEQRKQFYLQQRKTECRQHVSKKSERFGIPRNLFVDSRPVSTVLSKSVQTDIQNIRNKLVQYELQSQNPAEKELNPQTAIHSKLSESEPLRETLIVNSTQDALLKREMDKPKSILSKRNTSPRDRLVSDYQHSYVPSFLDGFSYQNKSDELEKERLKRETYQTELRMQIEEKRRMSAMRDEQERREQELENRRLEQQLLRMQEEELMEQRRSRRDEQLRRNSEEFCRRKQELQSRSSYRKHSESESGLTGLRNTTVASKSLSHYSPPISRRNPYSSYTLPSSSVYPETPSRYRRFDAPSSLSTSRYDSLSRIDMLKRQDSLSKRLDALSIGDTGFNSSCSGSSRMQRRHSATQQDLRRSPKLQRRSGSGRFEDTLPVPLLKAHSPVAKELRNSIAISSSRSGSDAMRRLEERWQIPSVQRNSMNHNDSYRDRDGTGKSILTQLGAIRMQLRQEQERMEESLRRRGITQSKAVDFH